MTRCKWCSAPIVTHVTVVDDIIYCSLGCWRYRVSDAFIDKNVKEETGGIYGAIQKQERWASGNAPTIRKMKERLGGRAAGDSGRLAKPRKG